MANKRIAELPNGNLTPETIIPIVTEWIHQNHFGGLILAFPYFSGGTVSERHALLIV
jgi:hypothetical protein